MAHTWWHEKEEKEKRWTKRRQKEIIAPGTHTLLV
jgi:hypothetical protein